MERHPELEHDFEEHILLWLSLTVQSCLILWTLDNLVKNSRLELIVLEVLTKMLHTDSYSTLREIHETKMLRPVSAHSEPAFLVHIYIYSGLKLATNGWRQSLFSWYFADDTEQRVVGQWTEPEPKQPVFRYRLPETESMIGHHP